MVQEKTQKTAAVKRGSPDPLEAARAKGPALELRLPQPPKSEVEKLPELELILIDDRGKVVETAALHGWQAKVWRGPKRSRFLKVVVAPKGMAPQAAAASKSLPSMVVRTGAEELEFVPGWWEKLILGQLIFYRGFVEKVMGDTSLPITEGTVEVYEVDPFKWILVLPEIEVARIRDDLVPLIEGKLPDLQREPQPGPFPGPKPGPWKELFAEPGRFGAGFEARGPELAAELTYAATPFKAAPSLPLSLGLMKGLAGTELRNYLHLHRFELLPYLCLLKPDWWYSKDKIGEVPIQADGTFFGFAGWWLPGQDRPDLYFRVRQFLDGADKVIYGPPISSSTWWNYVGEEVPIRVTDPAAVASGGPVTAEGDQIVFLGVGFDTTTDVAGARGLIQVGSDLGLYRYASGKVGPYGKEVHVALDVDLQGLLDAGVRYFRLTTRPGAHTEVGDPTAWTPLTEPLARHYRLVSGTSVSYPTVSLVPEPGTLPLGLAGQDGIFRFPAPGLDYVVIERRDRAFGIWKTQNLPGVGETHGDVAGVYTIRLEVFNTAGGDVTASTPILRIHQHELDGSYSTTGLDPLEPMLYVHVDNRSMTADIRNLIEAGTSSTATGCGFLSATASAAVETGIKAFHPGALGFAADPDRFLDRWTYRVRRGAAAQVMVHHVVDSANVGDLTSYYELPNAGVPAQTVGTLLNGLVPSAPEIPRRCTFTVTLRVDTLTRNGYGILDEYDSWDTSSFALMESTPPPNV